MVNEIQKKAWNVREFCEAYGICETVGRRLIRTEDFPKIVIGRRYVLPIDSVEKYMLDKVSGEIE
jgi:hypothetical protein